MNVQDYVSIIAQTGTGEIFKQGMREAGHGAIGIDPQLGLVVLARDRTQRMKQAHKTIEILLDDMQLNLPTSLQQSQSDNPGGDCLRESLDNINEYLLSRSQMDEAGAQASEVSVIAAQFLRQQCSVIATGDYQCLFIRDDRLQDLLPDRSSSSYLGKVVSIHPGLAEPELQPGDTLFLMSSESVTAIGKDFIRITLSRFGDNLDMAMRQVNTRASRQGITKTPEMAICRIQQSQKEERSWLDKLRQR